MRKALQCSITIMAGLVLFFFGWIQSSTSTRQPTNITDSPIATVAVAPGYPPLALSSGTSGEVKVKVVVSPDGRVTTAEVVGGPRLLREGCQEAALQWVFQPRQGEQWETELTFRFLIAPPKTPTAKLETIFRQPDQINIIRSLPRDEKSIDPRGKVKR